MYYTVLQQSLLVISKAHVYKQERSLSQTVPQKSPEQWRARELSPSYRATDETRGRAGRGRYALAVSLKQSNHPWPEGVAAEDSVRSPHCSKSHPRSFIFPKNPANLGGKAHHHCFTTEFWSAIRPLIVSHGSLPGLALGL